MKGLHYHFGGIPTFWRSHLVPIEESHRFDAVVVGIPYDSGVSFRQGAKYAPRAIREAAFAPPPPGRKYINLDAPEEQLTAWDHQVGDVGDIAVWPMDAMRTHNSIRNTICEIRKQTLPVIIGGDHSVTYPALLGCREALGNREFGLVYFDGDPDTEDSFITLERYWHGDCLRRLIDDGQVDGRDVFLVGLRGIVDEQIVDWVRSKGVTIYARRDVHIRGINKIIGEIAERLSARTNAVYVSVDIDVVDASVAPGTGWPGWGGLSPQEILTAVRLLSRLQIVAFDLVEVSPPLDPSGLTVILAFEILWSFLRFGYCRHP